ncbi:HD domain-containing protein [Desulfitobacterium sp. PCE1]|uniref:HD domain-containing protein n=1 Tax=Desulfitobacterium sp. PCE1 TaxID=146907 RepID=UPI00037543A5|nr:HD domain-containing protein [Desulfitobacterium sp. PCE1]
MKTFRDPVHNIVSIDKESEKVLLDLIDTKEFQRLRHIRQLGLSSFTYPGAEHTRFIHSLGVVHLTKRFIDKISTLKNINQRYIDELHNNRMLALVAALLHDIGHGPFSHALEKTTKIKHESWTIEIITGDTEVKAILEAHKSGFSGEVAEVIRRTHQSKAIVKLLSSQLDTDRIDYLIRDSKFTGAGYGAFDLEWLINCLRIGEVNGDTEFGLDLNKGLSIAEDFVMARYYMYVNVYFHRATRSAELIIDKIFQRAIELKNLGKIGLPEDLAEIINKSSTSETLANYLSLSESTIWHYIVLWSKHEDNIISDLCTRLLDRRLFKEIQIEGNLIDFTEKVINSLKEHGLPREYYLLADEATSSSYKDHYITQKPKSEGNENEREASEQIFLFDKNGDGIELSNKSKIINQIRNEGIKINRMFIPEQIRRLF